MYWPLMEETITFMDRLKMAKFILTSGRLTNGPRVRRFEKEWSDWLGTKNSLYVGNGSLANFLLVAAVKEYYDLKDGDKVLVPATTWMTNVAPIIQNNLEPIFCDINLNNYSFDKDELKYVAEQHPDIKMVFITHLIGLSSDVEYVKEIFPDALILEDVCESHGVEGPDGKKRGTHSIGSTFSFYFGHHITTIEGGMICTDNEELYDLMRIKRSHGMARESDLRASEYAAQNPNIDPAFLFVTDGYNFRNHEVCAVLGSSQLKKLDRNVEIRRKNYEWWLKKAQDYIFKYHLPEFQKGNSSFSFPLICREKENAQKLKQVFKDEGIEYRPVISGNLLYHPAFRKYSLCTQRETPNVNILHDHGLYVGNSQFVCFDKLQHLIQLMDI
tara:strand:+ start:1827 stop:2984 length:1158 start_codon:yes stop_codon:yes gene_type:complete